MYVFIIHHWFFSSDLTHYKRGGRLSATSAFMGTLLPICPLMCMNDDGKLTPRAKVRGKNHVIAEIVHRMEVHARDGVGYAGECFITSSACDEDAREVANRIEEKFPNLEGPIQITNIGASIGSHTGVGTVALFFIGDRRTS